VRLISSRVHPIGDDLTRIVDPRGVREGDVERERSGQERVQILHLAIAIDEGMLVRDWRRRSGVANDHAGRIDSDGRAVARTGHANEATEIELMAKAWLPVPPSVPRSVICPFS
jgi:hypothetical protein